MVSLVVVSKDEPLLRTAAAAALVLAVTWSISCRWPDSPHEEGRY
jgi:hypothetical protein